jgi:tetratricopeptide (TPR) repeat protein
VPFTRNEYFTGREDELRQLRERLTGQGAAALSQTAAIHGLGGVGKTQTAIEYAWRHRDDYDAVFWVPAETETAIRTAFCEIARRLELPQKDAQDESLIIAAVLRWLETNPGWLLIFDNVDDPQLVVPYRPTAGRGHILVTSRHDVFDCLHISQPLELGKLPAEEAQEFLLKRAQRTQLLEPELTAPQRAERHAAADLVVELDFLALAIEQAGAYLRAHRATSIADYLAAYRKRGLEVLALMGPEIGGSRKSVATTWSLNFEQVEQSSPAAADLLRFFALLHPDNIPWELITAGAPELGENLATALSGDDPLALGELLRALTRYSLIEIDEDDRTCSVHRLVQEVLRSEMRREDTLRAWQERMVRGVDFAFPSFDLVNWARCERLLPQTMAVAEVIFTESIESPAAARLLNKVANYHARGPYGDAHSFYLRAMAIQEKVLGTQHPEVAVTLNNLAVLYDTQGRYSQAETLYLRALAIDEAALGGEHAVVAIDLNNLGVMYVCQGRYEKAELLYKRAIAILEKGHSHRLLAICLKNYAILHIRTGREKEARAIEERANRLSVA